MRRHCSSSDGCLLSYELSGQGPEALLFVHGWLGNARWWDEQKEAFGGDYQIIQIDLAGHGRSEKNRRSWSVGAYANDIRAVAADLDLKAVHLIGHSMSGSNVLEAARQLDQRVRSVVLVDTLLDLDAMPSREELDPLFAGLRTNYQATMEMAFEQFLLVAESPEAVRQRLKEEMLSVDPELAAACLEPFYKTDIRPTAAQLKIPVRAINSDRMPTQALANRKYLRDFDYMLIAGVGHYPMLEKPTLFNAALRKTLVNIKSSLGRNSDPL